MQAQAKAELTLLNALLLQIYCYALLLSFAWKLTQPNPCPHFMVPSGLTALVTRSFHPLSITGYKHTGGSLSLMQPSTAASTQCGQSWPITSTYPSNLPAGMQQVLHTLLQCNCTLQTRVWEPSTQTNARSKGSQLAGCLLPAATPKKGCGGAGVTVISVCIIAMVLI